MLNTFPAFLKISIYLFHSFSLQFSKSSFNTDNSLFSDMLKVHQASWCVAAEVFFKKLLHK
jgi:hypothetical protein